MEFFLIYCCNTLIINLLKNISGLILWMDENEKKEKNIYCLGIILVFI